MTRCIKTLLSALVIATTSLANAQKAAQLPRAAARVTASFDRKVLSTLSGTHPGIVERATLGARLSPGTKIEHMILVLKPSEEQEVMLHTLLDSQQDKGSASFHQWLTPSEFGTSFGVAASDVSQVSQWLTDSGLSIEGVAHSGRFITFSGSVGAVESAFNTEMRHVTVGGEQHISNTTDIAIPAALAPVVKGVARLNNFFPKSGATDWHKVSLAKHVPNSVELDQPEFGTSPTGTHYIAPGDLASIYNATPLTNAGVNGSGTTIAVLARSNIRLADVQAFRSLFGLPKNDPNIIVVGSDPGENADDVEAFLDAEMAGSLATGATVDFIVSSASLVGEGIDTAGLYAVDNNIGDIITLSYGGCETSNGASGTAFWNTLWEEAAAQGQTAFVSSGDSGAATCDSSSAAFSTQGYGVNALGSSAYNVAVGGSIFVDYNPAQYWGSATNIPYASALGYIPEAALNQGRLTTTYLNSAATAPVAGSGIFSDGGGISIYTPRPSWQTGSGIPTTSDAINVYSGTGIAASSPITGLHRLVPDLSFISASGHDGTLFCYEGGCYENSTGSLVSAGIVGGTSVAAPAMASAQALINAVNGGRQGNANFFYYPLSNAQYTASATACQAPIGTATSTTVTLPASTCNFHDIIAGSNIVPTAATGTAGIGFSAGVGFDEASGLGSVNIANVATNWKSVTFRATTTSLALTPTSTIHGANQYALVQVTAVSGGTPTGDVSLIASLETATGTPQVFTLSGGAVYGLVNSLPAGTYTVHAHYQGDSVFGSSDSLPVSVTIGKEASSTSIFPNLITAAGSVTPLSSFTYGSGEIYLDTEITPASGNGTASGAVTYTVKQNGLTLPGLTTSLDTFGTTYLIAGPPFTNFYLVPNYATLSPGTYVVSASYAGDTSFIASIGSATFTVVKAVPTVSFTTSTAQITSAATATLNFSVTTPTSATPASGTVLFTDTTTGTPLGSATLSNGAVSFSTNGITASGANIITATYSGDTNYSASTVSSTTVTVTTAATTTTLLSSTTAAPIVGGSVNLTATVSPIPTTSALVYFYDSGRLLGSAAASTTTGVATLAVSSFTAGIHAITATYAGTTAQTSSTGSYSITVAKNVTTMNFSGGETASYGQTVSFNGYIVRSPTSTTLPAVPLTGTVNFYDSNINGTLLGSATPVFGPGGGRYVATINLTTLSVGQRGIVASYTGDANYAATTSIVAPVTITQGTPTIAVTSLSIPSGTTSATLTATLAYPGASAPTGGLLFTVDGGPTVPATCAGGSTPLTCSASYPTASLGAGTHTITATEGADSNYSMASGTGTLTVSASTTGTPQLISTGTLYSQANGSFVVAVTVANTGTGPALNAVLTGVSIGSVVATSLPQGLGTIAAGSSVTTTVTVPATAGVSGSPSVERIAGTYTGGSFGGSLRITLP